MTLGPEPRDPGSPRDIHQRRRGSRWLAIGATLCLTLSGVLPGPALAAKPSGGSGCSLIPELRDVTINQGVGSYARLVRGKETLVRLYLSLPSCASTSQSIAIEGGTLAVSAGGVTTPVGPFPVPAAPFPRIATYDTAPALDAPGDPTFVVPGSLLAPASTSGSFSATFSATITYRSYSSRRDSTGTLGTVTFTKFPSTQTNIGATVEARTNALRILAVPMGDASQSYASQFSSTAQSALESGMLTLSRIFPVPDGTGDLAGTTGGVRYTILPTLLDVGARLGSDGKFCGGGATFDAIKGELAQFLLSWNSANPSATADRVVGVVDEAISNGSSLGCADGWSAIGTPESWVRAITSESPGKTGALLAMEVGHSMGLVPTNRDHTFDPYHSPNQEADGGTNRGYDIRSHTFIADDRTALRGTGTWNNATTLLEPIDYAYLLCVLGGSVTTDCTTPGSVGTASGVGAGPRFVISGTTGGTAATTVVTESYFAGDVALTEPPAASGYTLRQLLDGATLADYPIAVETVESLHAHPDDPTHESGSALQLFAAVVPFDERANRIELRHDGQVLYTRDRGQRPVITSTQVVAGGEENYTDDLNLDDTWPMVSPDAAWVAWTEDDGEISRVVVGPIDDAGAAVALASEGGDTQPAWNPVGDELAFIRDGDVVTVAMTFPDGVPTFGAETVVYDSDTGGPPAANHPSWSPDGTHIAFDATGAIFVVEALESSPAPEQLTFTGDASHPSWSWTPGDDRIAYQREIAAGPILLSEPITLASYVRPTAESTVGPASHVGTQFTVTAGDDAGDGTCDATCTLREAITAANLNPGKDSIHFNIEPLGSKVIALASQLPSITDAVVIDGTTQPQVFGCTDPDPCPPPAAIQLDGADAGASARGLVVRASDVEIIGLSIGSFGAYGIELTATLAGAPTSNATISRSLIGVALDGSTEVGNGAMGIYVDALATDNLIGGLTDDESNVISGNSSAGIRIDSSGNRVFRNYIGTNASGTAAVSNADGLILVGAAATGNAIGMGTVDGSHWNVISGNGQSGILLSQTPGTTTIESNFIGVGRDGATALANGSAGILAQIGADDVQIGDGTAEGANVIAFNGRPGVAVNDSPDNESSGIRIARNSIHTNGTEDAYLGIDLGSDGVTPNDPDDADLGPNGLQNFPVIEEATGDAETTTVFFTLSSAPDTSYRVELYAVAACDPSGHGEGTTFLEFATLVTDETGNGGFVVAVSSSDAPTGSFITATATNDVTSETSEFSACAEVVAAGSDVLVVNSAGDAGTGGCTVDECTLREAINSANATAGASAITFDIPGSGVHTIQPASQLPPLTDAAVVDATTQPGYAGTPLIELDGSALSPFGYGLVVNTSLSTVRGFAIHGFPDAGIYIDTAGAAGGNTVVDNWIGTDAAGAAGVGNGIGVYVFESPDNAIEDNVISGNDGAFYAVGIFGGPSGPSVVTGNVVQGNLIGVAPDGTTALPNAGHGVVVNDVSGSRIGGIEAGQANLIANSGGAGVSVAGSSTTGNAILGNSIYDNGSLGIDLGGGGSIATNDSLDADTGPNNLQNYPSVGVNDDGTTISGTLLSAQVADYRIELFRSADCDGSGNGEGQEYLGFVDVTTNADGYATFTFDSSADPITPTDVVAATATDEDDNTSEFSACAAPTPTGTQVWTLDPADPSTSQERLVANAAQPAFGADGRVAFVRDDAIYSIGADGTGVAQLTTPGAGTYDSMPSLGGVPAFARFFDNFDGGGQWDVFLLRGQVQMVTTVTDDNPADLRLDIYYQCLGSPAYDVAVALPPDDVETGSATWTTNYDPSLACPDGTLTAIASDGFLRSDSEEAGSVDSDPQAPVPTIYAPFEGQEFLQYQGISLHGGAKDAEDGEVADAGLAWFLDGSSVGTGRSINLSPPGAGWSSGPHTVTLRATDSDGTFVETIVEIVVLADEDNDWLPADVEADATCFEENADSDPTNAFGDADGDSYSNLDDMHTDEGPCIAATEYSVLATFGPDILYVPSKGDEVTITVQSTNRDLSQVAGSTVRISDLSGAAVSFFATSWKVDKKGVGTALFDRQAVTAFLSDNGLVGQTVTVTVVGESLSHSWIFSGTDTFEAMAAN